MRPDRLMINLTRLIQITINIYRLTLHFPTFYARKLSMRQNIEKVKGNLTGGKCSFNIYLQ